MSSEIVRRAIRYEIAKRHKRRHIRRPVPQREERRMTPKLPQLPQLVWSSTAAPGVYQVVTFYCTSTVAQAYWCLPNE